MKKKEIIDKEDAAEKKTVCGGGAGEIEDTDSVSEREMTPSGDPEADAQMKLNRLLFCGNDRVELSAAKEILSMAAAKEDDGGEIKLDVTIKIV